MSYEQQAAALLAEFDSIMKSLLATFDDIEWRRLRMGMGGEGI